MTGKPIRLINNEGLSSRKSPPYIVATSYQIVTGYPKLQRSIMLNGDEICH